MNKIKPVSCRVASFLDNKIDRGVYEEAVCEINRANAQPQKELNDISTLEKAVTDLEKAVSEAPPSSRYYAEGEINRVRDALAKVQRRNKENDHS